MNHRKVALPKEFGAGTSFEAEDGDIVCFSNARSGTSPVPTFLHDSLGLGPVTLFIVRRNLP